MSEMVSFFLCIEQGKKYSNSREIWLQLYSIEEDATSNKNGEKVFFFIIRLKDQIYTHSHTYTSQIHI